MNVLKAANLALSFFLELCMVVAYAYWGLTTGGDLVTRLLLGIGVPVVVIVVWGIFMAPASSRRLRGLSHWILEILLYAGSMVALFIAGRPDLVLIFAVIYAINAILRLIWKQ